MKRSGYRNKVIVRYCMTHGLISDNPELHDVIKQVIRLADAVPDRKQVKLWLKRHYQHAKKHNRRTSRFLFGALHLL